MNAFKMLRTLKLRTSHTFIKSAFKLEQKTIISLKY